MNSIKCENIYPENGNNQQNIDFRCECKDSSKYYGKRCEHKINLCQNEKCSGNGLCKIINENQQNETIKCECFGFGLYEGEKCQIKSSKLKVIQTIIKSTTYIAVLIIIIFYLLIFMLDVHTFLTKSSSVNKNKQNRRKNPVSKPKKLVYIA